MSVDSIVKRTADEAVTDLPSGSGTAGTSHSYESRILPPCKSAPFSVSNAFWAAWERRVGVKVSKSTSQRSHFAQRRTRLS